MPNCTIDGRSRVGIAKHFRRDHKDYRSWRDVFIRKDAPNFVLRQQEEHVQQVDESRSGDDGLLMVAPTAQVEPPVQMQPLIKQQQPQLLPAQMPQIIQQPYVLQPTMAPSNVGGGQIIQMIHPQPPQTLIAIPVQPHQVPLQVAGQPVFVIQVPNEVPNNVQYIRLNQSSQPIMVPADASSIIAQQPFYTI